MHMIVPVTEQSSQNIDPNDLLIFARVAELGSFSRAADRLGLPKSTVSRRLAALEQRVGERLLLRTTRRQTLTEFGQLMLEHARQVVTEVEAVAALSAHRQAAPSGRLRVSMPSDFANLLLVDTLAAFVAMHPAIALELDLSPRRVDLLGEGFDVAVRVGDLPDDALLAARRLAVFPQGLYASPTYLAEHGEPQAPADLAQHEAVRQLRSDGEPASWTLIQGEQRWQGVPHGRASANSPELLIRLACAGAGIAAVPDYFALPHLRQGALRRVLPSWCLPSPTAWAVFPGRKLMPAKTRAFIDMLQVALGGADDSARGGHPPVHSRNLHTEAHSVSAGENPRFPSTNVDQ
jgi:DNA-binding transcriptional LysR family regulator